MGITLGDSSYNSLTTNTVNSSYQTDSLKNSISSLNSEDATDESMLEACKSFEAYFIEQVYKEMKKSVHSSEEDNQYLQYFGDMMTQQYASDATEGQGLGIAQMLYESMKNNNKV